MDELQVQIFQWTQLDKQLKEINKQLIPSDMFRAI